MDVKQFNEISARLDNDVSLRRKVQLQSYFYRIAADLDQNLKKPALVLPTIDETKRHRMNVSKKTTLSGSEDSNSFSAPDDADSKFIAYCKIIRNVEIVRSRMIDRLKVRRVYNLDPSFHKLFLL